MKRIYKICLGLSVFIFLNGCIHEGALDCPREERYVCFKSVMKKYDFRDIVDHTTLYLYNDVDELVFKRTYTKEELIQHNYRAPLPVQKPGAYTLVASMNSGDDYLKNEAQKLSDFRISLIPDRHNHVTRQQSDIYHGSSPICFTGEAPGENECDYLVWLYKNTNYIHVTLTHNGYTPPPGGTIRSAIEGDNGTYNHRNENLPNHDRIYIAHTRESEPVSEFFLSTVMHIRSRNNVVLKLEEFDGQGVVNTMQEKDLIQEFLKIYPTDEELDQVDLFDVKIELGDNMTIVSMTVNGWYTIRDGVEIP